MDTPHIGIKEPPLVLPRAGDKLVSLKPGDVIRAQVVRILSGGELSLNVGGSLIQAKIGIPVPQGASVLFRVLGQEADLSGKPGVRLQFLHVAEDAQSPPAPATLAPGRTASPVLETFKNLVDEFASHAPLRKDAGGELGAIVRQLLKTLPEDSSSLPKDLRNQLLGLVQKSLRDTELNIQDRAVRLLGEEVAQESTEPGEHQAVKVPIFAEAEAILRVPMRSVLGDTGVTLESKLKALAREILLSEGQPAEDNQGSQELPGAFPGERVPVHPALATDLKARLLQLREKILQGDAAPDDAGGPSSKAGVGSSPSGAIEGKSIHETMLPMVDGLLQDIETFQLLSRLTESFCTFLPFVWKGLKEGDVAFKRGRSRGAEPSHYCVMNLDFEALGKITIVAMMQGGEFFVSFKAEDQALRSVLDENIPELQNMFVGEGLKLKGVSFLDVDDPQLVPFENLETLDSLLNLKI